MPDEIPESDILEPATEPQLPQSGPVPHAPVPAALRESSGYLLRRAFLRAEAVGLHRIPVGGHPRDFALLTLIDVVRPGSQLELADSLSVNRSVMVKLADGLEGRGLIRRERNPADRRRYMPVLTDIGRDYLHALRSAVTDGDREFTVALTDSDAAELRALLRPVAAARLTASTPDELFDLAAFLSTHAHFRIQDLAFHALAGLKLQPRHFGLLSVLDNLGPVPQQQLARDFGVSPAAMVDTVDGLEKSGRVRRARSPVDRRAYALTLTARGDDDLAAARPLVAEVERIATAPLGAGGRTRMNALLAALVEGPTAIRP